MNLEEQQNDDNTHFENWQSYTPKIPSIFVYNLTFLPLETPPLQSKHSSEKKFPPVVQDK